MVYKKKTKELGEVAGFALYCLLSIPKTIYFNFKCLPFSKAVKLPILVGWNVKLVEIRGRCVLNGGGTFVVRIGHGGSLTVPAQRSSIRMREGSVFQFNGKARLAAGNVLDIGGQLSIGRNFSSNRNAFISCENKVTIGDDVLLGWDVHIFDNDGGHTIIYDGVEKTADDSSINIGNHVWLCSYSHVMKGAQVPDGSILGYRSLLLKKIEENNVLIAGSPADVRKHGVDWKV